MNTCIQARLEQGTVARELTFVASFSVQEFEKCLKANGSYGSLSEDTIKDASKRAHVSTNEQLHATSFDDTLSGTTAISLLLKVQGLFLPLS